MEASLSVGEAIGKLACGNGGPADGFEEAGLPAELDARVPLRVEDADWLPEFTLNDTDGLKEIGIVREDDGELVVVAKGIPQQVRRKIHVRALFFGLENLDAPGRVRIQGHVHGMGQVVAVMDGEVCDRLEGSEIHELPRALPWIPGAGADERRVVTDAVDGVAGQEEGAEFWRSSQRYGVPFRAPQ